MFEFFSDFNIVLNAATAPLPAGIDAVLNAALKPFHLLLFVPFIVLIFFHYLEKIITRYFVNKKKLEQKNDISNVLSAEQNKKTPDILPTPKKIYFSNWSMDLLKSLEHDKFIQLCAILFSIRYNLKPKLFDSSIDYGFNVGLYRDEKLLSFLRCEIKPDKINVNLIREFSGTMGFNGIKKSYFISVGSFSDDSKLFSNQAMSKNYQQIFLISGENLLKVILSLPREKQKKLLAFVLKN